jgi:predicted ribonuclease toxin of YeeF-YezG toxin-antitoxin module
MPGHKLADLLGMTLRSITVKRNVVFNPNNLQDAENITISSGDILSEGERNKVIQNPERNVKLVDKSKNESNIPNLRQSEPEKDVPV